MVTRDCKGSMLLDRRWRVGKALIIAVCAVLAPDLSRPMAVMAQVGSWDAVRVWPTVAIHSTLLPNGKVLFCAR